MDGVCPSRVGGNRCDPGSQIVGCSVLGAPTPCWFHDRGASVQIFRSTARSVGCGGGQIRSGGCRPTPWRARRRSPILICSCKCPVHVKGYLIAQDVEAGPRQLMGHAFDGHDAVGAGTLTLVVAFHLRVVAHREVRRLCGDLRNTRRRRALSCLAPAVSGSSVVWITGRRDEQVAFIASRAHCRSTDHQSNSRPTTSNAAAQFSA